MPQVFPGTVVTGQRQPLLLQLSKLFALAGFGGNAQQVQATLRESVSNLLAQVPDARLVDLQLCGGGPGNTFLALALVTTATDPAGPGAPTVYPLLSDCVFTAIEAASNFDQLLQIALGGTPNRFLVAWSQAIGGAGSPYMTVSATVSAIDP
jgi:hypothetical protein